MQQSIKKFAGAVWANAFNPWWWVSLIFAYLVGRPLIEFTLGPKKWGKFVEEVIANITIFVDNPFVRLGMIPLVVICFWLGVRSINAKAETVKSQQLFEANAMLERANAIETHAAEQIKPFLRIQQAFVVWFAEEQRYRQSEEAVGRLRSCAADIVRQSKDIGQDGCWDVWSQRSFDSLVRNFNSEVAQIKAYGLSFIEVPSLVVDDQIEATSNRIIKIIDDGMLVLANRLSRQRDDLVRMHHND